MKGTRWTADEDEFIKAHRAEGARRVTDGINRRFGTLRTVNAVTMRASRLGVSLMQWDVCPSCGRPTRQLEPDGVCLACHYDKLRANMRAERKQVQAEIAANDEKAREAYRSYQALKTRLYRERKNREKE